MLKRKPTPKFETLEEWQLYNEIENAKSLKADRIFNRVYIAALVGAFIVSVASVVTEMNKE